MYIQLIGFIILFNTIIKTVLNFWRTIRQTKMDINVVGCILSTSFQKTKFILQVSSISYLKLDH